MANPMGRSCVCDEELSTVHVLSCKKMRGVFVRHDFVERCYEEDLFAGRRSGKYRGDGRRRTSAEDGPGAVFFEPSTERVGGRDGGQPQAPSYVGKDAVVCREKAKRSRWSEAASKAGIEFCPFVVDTFGKFGEGAKSVLDAIAESALQSFPYPIGTSSAHWKGTFVRGWRWPMRTALS